MPAIYDLPVPGSADLASSNTLSQLIRQAIDSHHGFLSFDRFMDLALYHPQLGYYNGSSFTLGKDGDFTTAPELSPVFAKTLARFISGVFTQLPQGNLLELGAGTGRFAGDCLTALQTLGYLPGTYLIHEPNAGLRIKQQQFLAAHYPAQYQRIQWIDTLPGEFQGVIFANEVLDALPVSCFRIDEQGISERGVSWENDSFVWAYRPATSTFLKQASNCQQHFALPAGYESEINLSMPSLLKSVAACLSKGVILFADYGYGQHEYYHPARNKGTLTCFYKHRHHDNPLVFPGLQDITAHVDFTYLAETAIEYDLSLAGFTTQAGFLLENGMSEIVESDESTLNQADAFKLHQAVKTLTMPMEMGERIKVMAFSRQFDSPLPGFRLQDRRRDL